MMSQQQTPGNKLIPGMVAPGNLKEEFPVPDNMIGLVIGKGGETIKGIHNKSGAHVFIPKECEPG